MARTCALICCVAVLLLALTPYFLKPKFDVYKTGVVVISGTSTGIGHDAVIDLAKKGYHVFAGIRKEKQAKNFEGFIFKGKVIPIILDVTESEHISKLLTKVTEYTKKHNLPLVGVVNNAGIGTVTPFELLNLKDGRKIFDVNFWGALELTQTFLPLIREHKSRILMINSLAGLATRKYWSMYTSSKFALMAATSSLRGEMLPFGVSVSSLNPGFVKTQIQSSIVSLKPNATDKPYDLYQNFYDGYGPGTDKLLFGNAPTPKDSTTPHIFHALTSEYPEIVYMSGRPPFQTSFLSQITPIALLPKLLGITPTLILDILLEL